VHIVIMGCGRVGSLLAHSLDGAGHSVAVVDQDASAFRRLDRGFSGKTVIGVGFDRDVLLEAQIETADAMVAVSSGDNSNILAARVARETFGVRTVVARIYDPRRAEVYERLGIPTVATVSWTADQIMHRVVPSALRNEWLDPSGAVVLTEVQISAAWVGELVSDYERQTDARVVCLTRFGEGLIPLSDTVIQDGDLVRVAARTSALERLQQVSEAGPEAH